MYQRDYKQLVVDFLNYSFLESSYKEWFENGRRIVLSDVDLVFPVWCILWHAVKDDAIVWKRKQLDKHDVTQHNEWSVTA